MGNKQGCLIFLLLLLALINIVGLYFIIDSNSRFTQAMVQNSEQLYSLQKELAKLGASGIRVSSAQMSGASHTNNNIEQNVPFANSEFRQPQAEYGGRQAVGISSFSGNLNYIVQNEATTAKVWNICNDKLADRNMMNPLEFQPQMAERWEQSADGLTFTVYLRHGVLWHPYIDPLTKNKVPAKELTSEDFLFYWQTMQNPDVPVENLRTYYKNVKSFTVLDRYSFRVVWSEPYFKALEMTLDLMAAPRHYFRPDPTWDDKEFAQQMRTSVRNQFIIGCGPYRFVRWKKGEDIRFERFEDYYGPKPYADEIILREIPERSIMLVELKKGSIDSMVLSPEQWVKETQEPLFKVVTPTISGAIEDSLAWDNKKQAGELPEDYNFEKYQYTSARMSWFYIGYNQGKKLFTDKRVRQALTMLTDRERILKDVFYGFGTILAGPFTPNSPYMDPTVKPFAFDPEKARQLLKEAGWEDHDGDGILDKDLDGSGKAIPFSYSLMIAGSSELARKFAAIIQADMKKVGIDMKVAPLEWSVMIDRLNERAYDACALGWTGSLEPDPYQIWHGSQADMKHSSNHVHFKNAEADRLIELGRKTIDAKKRTEIFREFYRLLHDEQPYTFLIAPVSLRAQSKRYYNSRVYKLGMESELQWVPTRLQGK